MKIIYIESYLKSLNKNSNARSVANDNIKSCDKKSHHAYTTSGELLEAVNGNEFKLADSYGRCSCGDY